MVFIKPLMNAGQIYTNLMQLKLNLRIGPIANSNCKKGIFMVAQINAFTLSIKSSFNCVIKNSPSSNRKPKGQTVPNLKNQI